MNNLRAGFSKNRLCRMHCLNCLITLGKIHDRVTERNALTAGLPLQNGKITPALFSRAAKRAGCTSHIVISRIEGINPALFPVILLLDREDPCFLHNVENRKISAFSKELSDASARVPLSDSDDRESVTAIMPPGIVSFSILMYAFVRRRVVLCICVW